jgi:hypothetical protein
MNTQYYTDERQQPAPASHYRGRSGLGSPVWDT